MTEHTVYLNGNKREFQKLLQKCLNCNARTYVLVESTAQALGLSEELWSAHIFLPHGLIGEKFCDKQLIVIASEPGPDAQIVINYEHQPPRSLPERLEKIIDWNHNPSDPAAVIYSYNENRWIKL